MVHPGALVGPGNDIVLLVIQQVSHLRLVVPVPEEDVSGITNGSTVPFQVPAYPERSYSGRIARISHALDQKTRTMAVELDVMNRDGSLAPGMYPTVKWPVHRSRPALFVPKTSVVTTTERTFVIRNQNGRAEWVDVKKGVTEGDLVEVMGNLKAGDMVVRRATDEMREAPPCRQRDRRSSDGYSQARSWRDAAPVSLSAVVFDASLPDDAALAGAPTNFTIELIERLADPIQHLVPARGETVDPRRLGPLGFRGSKPAARGHPRQHRIQRARTQAIAVALQFLEHPLAVDTLLVGMMKDVNLPEREQELADDRIAHGSRS